jgi:hypothetical protein
MSYLGLLTVGVRYCYYYYYYYDYDYEYYVLLPITIFTIMIYYNAILTT